jgi:ABC-type sugar transport system substrate-binding protein
MRDLMRPVLCALLGLVAACDGGSGGGTAGGTTGGGAPPPPAGGKVKIALVTKYIGNEYFNSCEKGAKKAADELGAEFYFDGPAQQDASKQLEFINACILKKYDAICIAPVDPNNVAAAVARAREKGIKVLTWDTDAPASGRDLMINQVDGVVLGHHAMDTLAKQVGEKGEFGIVIGNPTAKNLNFWREHIEARAKEKYPAMKHVDTRYSDEKREKGIDVTKQMIDAFPNLVGIIAVDSVSLPAAAEAVKQKGKAGKIAVTGFSTPNDMRQYVKDGTVGTFILWSPVDLGELTVRAAHHLVKGGKVEDGAELPGWKGGKLKVQPTRDNPQAVEVIMSPPTDFTKDNVDQFNF